MPKSDLKTYVNFELYKFFYYSASELNFSKAAENLHVTQSAVSQAIKSLEISLGVDLFFRHGRHVKLTHEGEVLFMHVEKAYHFLRSGENAIQSIKSLDEGTIFIGASDTLSRYYLISQIKAFHNIYPKVKIAINNRPSPRSVEYLKKGEIDLALINIPENHQDDDLLLYDIDQIDNVFICHVKHQNILKTAQSIKTLNALPLICLEEKSTTRKIMKALYDEHQLPLKPSFEFGSMDVIIESVKADMGIGFVPKNIALEAIQKGDIAILQTREKIPSLRVAIATYKGKPLSLAAQTFLEQIIADSAMNEKGA